MAALEIYMELTYSNQLQGFDPDKRYRNPEHFDKPEAGVTSVLVMGNWPSVVVAYEAAGIEVTVEDFAPVLMVDGDNHLDQAELTGMLRAESDTLRTLIVGLEAGEMVRPEAGELAIRLFDALDVIRLQLNELADQRDQLAQENEKLQAEANAFKPVEGGEIDVLKAKLDAANVSYRANASKEALEKLVADLPKA